MSSAISRTAGFAYKLMPLPIIVSCLCIGARHDNGQMGNGGRGATSSAKGCPGCAIGCGVCEYLATPRGVDSDIAPRWMPVRPNSDTALPLALCHVLHRGGLVDSAFVERYAVGYGEFVAYLDGQADGVVKNAAQPLTGIAEADITALAHEMAGKRTMIASAGRSAGSNGVNSPSGAIALATLLGQIDCPGRIDLDTPSPTIWATMCRGCPIRLCHKAGTRCRISSQLRGSATCC